MSDHPTCTATFDDDADKHTCGLLRGHDGAHRCDFDDYEWEEAVSYPGGKWTVHSITQGRHHIVAFESDWAIPVVAAGMTSGTADYIAALHNQLVPAARNALAVLRDVEWKWDDECNADCCPSCDAMRRLGHADCALAAAIKELGGVFNAATHPTQAN